MSEMDMADYELSLQTQIVSWKCSRYAHCNMKFIRKPRHIKLGMRGLVWSIEALALQNPSEYSFIIMDAERSEAAAPNLAAKFELLRAGCKSSMKTVRRVEEALDKLYAFSRLFALAERNRRWEIVLDAQITATACESAEAAVHEAAQAAAALLGGHFQDRFLFSSGGEQMVKCERSGWWIENWKVEDELWAASFFPRDSWKCMMRSINADAVEKGSVVQWCTVRIFDEPNPNFQFEVAISEFVEGDHFLLRIGVADDRGLKVRVFLTENVDVVCSQEGIESRTSLGLAYLLPGLVKDYIRSALGLNEDEVRNRNVVQGLIEHLIRYLVFLGHICVICGKERPFYAPWKSRCSDICKARKQRYKDAIAAFLPGERTLEEERRKRRREQYVKHFYPNLKKGRNGLAVLLNSDVLKDEESRGLSNEDAIAYGEAVERVTKMVTIHFLASHNFPINYPRLRL